ncbi:FAD-dependent oxidoreductase [Frigidibacter sp. MR17.24]|uniref:FAD-dependent oxidoreductase n=1 Tax=Frigidibacter sp. MR17.24 TaxID=3127345 RepID=UPI0030131104
MSDRNTQDTPDFAAGIAADRLRPGQPLLGRVGEDEVVLVRHEGGIAALSAKCTHLGATLDKGLVTEGQIRCPWHHARFSLADGTAVGGPAVAPLSCYPVSEAGGRVTVGPKPDRPGTPGRSGPAERIVIVGTGAAGHALAAALGRAGRGRGVTLIGAEDVAPYDRTFCSKQYLQGAKSRDETLLPRDGLREVTLMTGTEVTGIDRAARQVVTAQGDRIDYDRLVLATGAAPKVPDFPGARRGHVLRSLADADALIEAAGRARAAVVLGASFIGLEAAAALKARGLEVTVVADDPVPLARILGTEAGRFVQGLHEENGVRFRLGTSVESFDGRSVRTAEGAQLAADLLVLGTGVAPRVALAEAAGLDLAEGGVAVDATLATSDPAIWAIGDIAAHPDPATGRLRRIEHWVHAERQGEHLAQDFLAGRATAFAAAPFFWSGHFGTQLRYVGHARPETVEIDGSLAEGDFAIRYRDGGGSALLTCGRDRLSLEEEHRREPVAAE